MQFFFCFIFLSFSLCSAEARLPKIKIGAIDLPPFFKFKEKKIEGSAVDAVESLLASHFQLEWTEIPLARGEYALKEGIIDVYTGYVRDEKYKNIEFSKDGYFSIEPAICSHAFKDKNFSNFTDVPKEMTKGKYLIFPEGSKVAFEIFKEKEIKLVRKGYNSDYVSSSIKMISLGRADFFLIPTVSGVKEVKKYPCLSLDGKKVEVYFSFSKNGSWKKKIDAIMNQPKEISSLEGELNLTSISH